MPKTESDEVVKQEEMVEEFIEEHRPILEDPDAGHGALSRVYVHGAQLITSFGKKSEEAARRATKASNDLIAAINYPRCSAGKVDKREKEYKRLLSEHERLLATFNLLTDFAALVKQRLDNEFDENGAPKEKASEAPSRFEKGVYVDDQGKKKRLIYDEELGRLQSVPADEADVVTFTRKPEQRPWWQRLFGRETS